MVETTPDIQLGFPKLPDAGSEAHFEVARQWLRDCDTDENHWKCRPADPACLPTRLIDVGDEKDAPTVRLYETKPDEKGRYIALSHPWGDEPHFCTNRLNIEEHKKKIYIDDLPNTFKDAVKTTRELGFQYLWIDSICIIQGPDGDFSGESKRMEEVFSSAYCVIAASRATCHRDGFLKGRPPRDWITFRRGSEAPFFICQAIDNFNLHVLEGSLNRRGWVLQERALSHRTIYFTDEQTYWECGEGVRCETLTKMHK